MPLDDILEDLSSDNDLENSNPNRKDDDEVMTEKSFKFSPKPKATEQFKNDENITTDQNVAKEDLQAKGTSFQATPIINFSIFVFLRTIITKNV